MVVVLWLLVGLLAWTLLSLPLALLLGRMLRTNDVAQGDAPSGTPTFVLSA